MTDPREYMDTPCEHNIYLDKYVCAECERREWAETCPVCLTGNPDRLEIGYACDKCNACVWYIEGGDKIYFTDDGEIGVEDERWKHREWEAQTPKILAELEREMV